MSEYVISTLAFSALGGFVFFLVTWWFRQLVRLAEQQGLQQRRRLAAVRYLLVALVFGGASTGTLLPIILARTVATWFIGVGFLLALVPAGVWWIRRVPILKSMGYGRPTTPPSKVA